MSTTTVPVLFHGTVKEFSVGQKVIATKKVSHHPAAGLHHGECRFCSHIIHRD